MSQRPVKTNTTKKRIPKGSNITQNLYITMLKTTNRLKGIRWLIVDRQPEQQIVTITTQIKKSLKLSLNNNAKSWSIEFPALYWRTMQDKNPSDWLIKKLDLLWWGNNCSEVYRQGTTSLETVSIFLVTNPFLQVVGLLSNNFPI